MRFNCLRTYNTDYISQDNGESWNVNKIFLIYHLSISQLNAPIVYTFPAFS